VKTLCPSPPFASGLLGMFDRVQQLADDVRRQLDPVALRLLAPLDCRESGPGDPTHFFPQVRPIGPALRGWGEPADF
jgi:hypothetical protein